MKAQHPGLRTEPSRCGGRCTAAEAAFGATHEPPCILVHMLTFIILDMLGVWCTGPVAAAYSQQDGGAAKCLAQNLADAQQGAMLP